MTTEKPLVELIKDRLAGDLRGLPVFHSVAVKLQQMLARRDFRIEEVIGLISEDQSLASQVLKVGNSSYYTGLSKVATIKDAVIRLGAQEIANLVMMASQVEQYRSERPGPGQRHAEIVGPRALLRHGSQVARLQDRNRCGAVSKPSREMPANQG